MLDRLEYSGAPEPAPIANIDAEAALLGALLSSNAIFDTAIDFVTAEDFYEPVHQRIFIAIQDAISMGRVASPVTLQPLFVDDPAIVELGGPSYLRTLMDNPAAVYGAKDFARQVAELSQARRLHDGILEVAGEIRDMSGGITPAKHAARVEAIAYEATASKHDRNDSFSAAESIRRVIRRVKSIQLSGVAIGAVAPDIPELEKVVGPLERSHLHIWAGRPGMGKSGLMCGAARSMAAAGYGVAVVSLEMGDIDLGQRFAADVAMALGEQILHAHIRDAKLTERELRVLEWAAEEIDALPLQLIDEASLTMSRLGMKLRKVKREFEAKGHTLDVVFVDYLQLLDPDRKTDNRTSDVTGISRGLKLLAKELKCCVVALSQLSRQVEQREIKIPQMSDLRESGAIEQDADTILFLYREAYYLAQREPDRDAKPSDWDAWHISLKSCQDHMDLICPKRRGGATGRAQVLFLKEFQAVRGRSFFHEPGGLFNG